MRALLFAGLAAGALLFAWSEVSFAQTLSTDLRLVTSPLPISLVTEPGTSVSTPIRIKNDGPASEQLRISLMKFKAYGENGAPQLIEPGPEDVFVSWVDFSEREFSLASQEWKTLTMTVSPPKESAFGYYYAVVFSRVSERTDNEDHQTVVTGGTAVLVLLDVRTEGARREVTLETFSSDKNFYEFLPATFRIRLKNAGNVHVAPYGNIFIKRVGGDQELTSLPVNQGEGRGNILPDSYREFETAWEDGFPLYKAKIEDGKTVRDGEGNIVRELVWEWQNLSRLRFGKYEAKLLVIYDDGTRDVPLESATQFWVLPWRIMAVALVLVLIALLGVKSVFEKIWKGLFRRGRAS